VPALRDEHAAPGAGRAARSARERLGGVERGAALCQQPVHLRAATRGKAGQR